MSFMERFQRHRTLYLSIVALLCLAAGWAAYRYFSMERYTGTSRIRIDLRHPDMRLATRNLAELPKDVADTPMLRGLVDEALVFHYEEDETRLSLEGSLRRLAYEHKLELQDHLLSAMLDAPATIGLWRSGNGRPEHYVVALERSFLGKLVETVARIALDDRQLKQAGSFAIGRRTLPLLTLDLGGGRTLAFVAAGDRWVFLSNPALVLDANNQMTADGADILDQLLDGDDPWRKELPASASAKHSFVVGAKALTLNYAHFLPALQGLRFDHDGKAWHPELRLDPNALPGNDALKESFDTLWRAVPAGAAACAAVPVNWTQATAPVKALVVGDAVNEKAVVATIGALDPLGAVCWFSDSRFNAPLFVARTRGEWPAETVQVLAAVADSAWSAQTGDEEKVEVTDNAAGEAQRFAASVPSLHGLRDKNAGEPGFEPTLARHGKTLYFSPDRRNVDAALAVADKQAMALGDLGALQGKSVWLFYDPQRLGRLTRAEVQNVLPSDDESFFREVARQRLWPRLDAWGQRQKAAAWVAGQAAGEGFVALDVVPVGNAGARDTAAR